MHQAVQFSNFGQMFALGARSTTASFVATFLLALSIATMPTFAQGSMGTALPASARTTAPVDLTGYWVSVITEDWRFRMVPPAKGDYQSVPLNEAGIKAADAWDPAKDEAAGEQCKYYGAPALMRNPGHLHITWEDDNTLKIETDAGTQTRILHFGDWKPRPSPPSWQGDSVAQWEIQRPGPGGNLKVVTSNLRAGYLRKNGVPYSANANLTEYFDVFTGVDGNLWLTITAVVTDPAYLRMPFITSSNFKKQSSGDGWDPSPCSARW